MARIQPRIPEQLESPVAKLVNNLSPHEKRNYSFHRLINYLCSNRRGDRCLEVEISEQLSREMPTSPEVGCCWAPLSLSGTRSGLDTKQGSAGGYLAETDVAPDLITLLRAKTLLLRLGAVLLPLASTTAMPVETTGST